MRRSFPQRLIRLCFALAFLALAAGVFAQQRLDQRHPALRAALTAQKEVTSDWMRDHDVLGTAVTADESGNSSVIAFVDRDSARAAEIIRRLPAQYRGVTVQVHLTDRFQAMKKKKKLPPGIRHDTYQAIPIQLGVSGGNLNDHSARFCCGGTLGSLVQIAGAQYVLSNWHVLEYNSGQGDQAVQPGLIDTRCDPDGVVVGNIEARQALPDNNVDCAIAAVQPGIVRADGSILEVGTISAQPVAAFINQKVKKSGRTTGLTRSYVMGLNATITVDYTTSCNGPVTFSKTFTGQIVCSDTRGSFLAGGDSGSLLVEDVTTNPHPIGLLFAGSSTDAIANPIDEVLAFLGATMVGN